MLKILAIAARAGYRIEMQKGLDPFCMDVIMRNHSGLLSAQRCFDLSSRMFLEEFITHQLELMYKELREAEAKAKKHDSVY